MLSETADPGEAENKWKIEGKGKLWNTSPNISLKEACDVGGNEQQEDIQSKHSILLDFTTLFNPWVQLNNY